jgi:holo-[acyl-carrier protein] synthase
MIIGIGTDIVLKSRINKIKDKLRFVKRILTLDEQEIYNTKGDKQSDYLAKRFAAKEAIAKAFGTGISSKLGFKDFAILNDSQGKPIVATEHKVLAKYRTHISISDEKDHCLAFAIIESSN